MQHELDTLTTLECQGAQVEWREGYGAPLALWITRPGMMSLMAPGSTREQIVAEVTSWLWMRVQPAGVPPLRIRETGRGKSWAGYMSDGWTGEPPHPTRHDPLQPVRCSYAQRPWEVNLPAGVRSEW